MADPTATPLRVVTADLDTLGRLAAIPGASVFTEPDLVGLVTAVGLPACHPCARQLRCLPDLRPTSQQDDVARHRRERLLRGHPRAGDQVAGPFPSQMYAAHVASLPLPAQLELAAFPTVADGNRTKEHP